MDAVDGPDRPGLARHTDPSTSHEAAEEVNASQQEREIWTALNEHRGDRWYNCYDLASDKRHMIPSLNIKYISLTPRMKMVREMYFVECKKMRGLNDMGKMVPQLHYRIRRVSMTFNIGERIQQVRALEAKIKAQEAALEEKLKPAKEWAEAARVEILQFLNQTNQKSANTPFGTAYWKPKVTYRVEDKSEFRAHVVGMEQWELLTWAAAGTAAEAFTNEHGEPPPGLVRNSVNILYINAPAKPRTKVAKASNGSGAEEPPMTPEEQEAEREAWARVEMQEREDL